MAIKSFGPISLKDIQTEYGGSAPIALSEYYYKSVAATLWPTGYTNYKIIPSTGSIPRRDGVWWKYDLTSDYSAGFNFSTLQIIGGGSEIAIDAANNSSGTNSVRLCYFGNNSGGEGTVKTLTGIVSNTIWVKIALTDPDTYGAYIKIGQATGTIAGVGYVNGTDNNGKIPSFGTNKFSNYYGASKGLSMIDYLVVAGGGGAGGGNSTNRGSGGGGGGGGFLSGTIATLNPGVYPIIVGAGGGRGGVHVTGSNGGDSSFNSIVAKGGGGGGSLYSTYPNGRVGGSGGGATVNDAGTGGVLRSGAAGTSGQGNAGGGGYTHVDGGNGAGAGGGGGAGSAGGDGGPYTSASAGGDGGNGKVWLNGIPYAGGGGGSTYFSSAAGGSGGTGGGGSVGSSGTANRGGGGGANVLSTGNGGGSGIVIIRYPGTAAQAAGGTITSSGGYVYHKFTSSGNLTF